MTTQRPMPAKPKRKAPAASVAAFLAGDIPVNRRSPCVTCANKALAADVAEFIEAQRTGQTTCSFRRFWQHHLVPKFGDSAPNCGTIQNHVRNCLGRRP